MQKILDRQYDATLNALNNLQFASNDIQFKQFSETLIQAIGETSTTNNEYNYTRSVYFTGIGKNDTIAEKTANMFRSLQFSAHSLNSVHAMHGDLGMVKDGDIIVAISKSGNTSELIHFLKYVNENFPNVSTYAVQVSDKTSKFDKFCQFALHLPEVKEIDLFDKVPTTSNIITQLYFDAIAVECAERKEFTLKEFVRSHPGGTIGGKD